MSVKSSLAVCGEKARKNRGGKPGPKKSLNIYPTAYNIIHSHQHSYVISQERDSIDSGREHSHYKLSNSHGPDIDFGAIFLPGQKFRGSIGWTATLSAERVRVAQDSCTVAQAEVCKEGPC